MFRGVSFHRRQESERREVFATYETKEREDGGGRLGGTKGVV